MCKFFLVKETEAVILPCKTCSLPFRTYVPVTNCLMPDGTTFYYSEPQDECPCCDITQWGAHWKTIYFHNWMINFPIFIQYIYRYDLSHNKLTPGHLYTKPTANFNLIYLLYSHQFFYLKIMNNT